MASPTSTAPRSLAALAGSAWPVRVAWFLLPLLAGPGLAAALDDRSDPVQLVAQVGLWGAWAATLAATLVPSTVSLTLVRTVAPAGVAAVVLAAARPEEYARIMHDAHLPSAAFGGKHRGRRQPTLPASLARPAMCAGRSPTAR